MNYLGDLCVMHQLNYDKEHDEPDVEADELSIKDIIPKKEN